MSIGPNFSCFRTVDHQIIYFGDSPELFEVTIKNRKDGLTIIRGA